MSSRGAPSAGPEGSEERDWVRRARRGDREAFGRLVERHQARAYRVALRILHDEEAARDAVQESFLKAWGSLSRFQERARFSTWLHRLVVNQSIDQLRREKPGRRVDVDDDGLDALCASPPPETWGVRFGPASEAMRSELRERLGEAIESLPDALREILLLREVEGLSYAEIAEVQSIPKGTVMSRLHYARRKAREALVAAGVAGSESP